MKKLLALLLCAVMVCGVFAACGPKGGGGGDETTTYTVKYYVVDGPAVSAITGWPSDTSVNAGGTVSKPANPTATGYTFDKWYTSNACVTEFDFSAAINANANIYGKFVADNPIEETFNVTYKKGNLPEGVEVTDWPQNTTVTEGDLITKPSPNPSAVDYNFLGWFTASGGSTVFDFDVAPTANVSIYAKWQIKSNPEATCYVLLDGNKYELVENKDIDQTQDSPPNREYSLQNFVVAEGDELEFYIDGVKIDFWKIGALGSSYDEIGGQAGSIVIAADEAGEYSFYVKFYSDWTVDVVKHGGDVEGDLEVGSYYIAGAIGGDWTIHSDLKLVAFTDEHGDQMKIADVPLTAGDKVKVVQITEAGIDNDYFDFEWEYMGGTESNPNMDGDGNYVITETGNYEFYLKLSTGIVWAGKQGGSVVEPGDVYVEINGTAQDLIDNSANIDKVQNPNLASEYMLKNVTVAEGDELEFYVDGAKIDFWMNGSFGSVPAKVNKITVASGKAGEYSFYLKLWSDSGDWVIAVVDESRVGSGYYMTGTFDGLNWGLGNAPEALVNSENEVKWLGVVFAADDEFKIVNCNTGEEWLTLNLKGDSTTYAEVLGGGNIKVKTAGTYDIYYMITHDSASEVGIWIQPSNQ